MFQPLQFLSLLNNLANFDSERLQVQFLFSKSKVFAVLDPGDMGNYAEESRMRHLLAMMPCFQFRG